MKHPDELKHHPGPGEEGQETTQEPAAEATAETGDKAPE